MGGATTSEECIHAYEDLKMKKTVRFITFKIDSEKEVTNIINAVILNVPLLQDFS